MSAYDTKYLRTAEVLIEEMNFSRAAKKLGIGQSALSKRITALHNELGYVLFVKVGRKIIATPAGEIYGAEAKISLERGRRAVELSRAAHAEAHALLHVGKSQYTDPYLMTILLSLEVPSHPDLRVEVTSKFSFDLMHDLLNGTLDVAFLTGVPDTPSISSILVSNQQFYVAMHEEDELAESMEVYASDLQDRSCILFDRHVQPYLYDTFLKEVRPASAPGASIQNVTTAEEASQLISRGRGIAVLTQAGAWRIAQEGITMRPLAVDKPILETHLACRSDNDSLLVSHFVKTFVSSLNKPLGEGNAVAHP